jgi:hypothetical protein
MIKDVGLAINGMLIANVVFQLVMNALLMPSGMVKLVNVMLATTLLMEHALDVRMGINSMVLNAQKCQNQSCAWL